MIYISGSRLNASDFTSFQPVKMMKLKANLKEILSTLKSRNLKGSKQKSEDTEVECTETHHK